MLMSLRFCSAFVFLWAHACRTCYRYRLSLSTTFKMKGRAGETSYTRRELSTVPWSSDWFMFQGFQQVSHARERRVGTPTSTAHLYITQKGEGISRDPPYLPLRQLPRKTAIALQNHRCTGCGLRVELNYVKVSGDMCADNKDSLCTEVPIL